MRTKSFRTQQNSISKKTTEEVVVSQYLQKKMGIELILIDPCMDTTKFSERCAYLKLDSIEELMPYVYKFDGGPFGATGDYYLVFDAEGSSLNFSLNTNITSFYRYCGNNNAFPWVVHGTGFIVRLSSSAELISVDDQL